MLLCQLNVHGSKCRRLKLNVLYVFLAHLAQAVRVTNLELTTQRTFSECSPKSSYRSSFAV